MKTWKIAKGDSTDLKIVTVENITDYTGYYGTLSILDKVTKEAVGATIALSPDVAEGFTAALLPEQTSSLAPGTYLVVLEISKGVTPVTYRKEINWMLEVSESLINI